MERDKAVQSAIHDTSNLARAFEEHIIRSIKTVDQTLLYARDNYERNPRDFDIVGWTKSTQAITDVTFQISLIDRNGILIKSSIDQKPGLDLSDREHFRVHRDSDRDELFISKPVRGRVSGKMSIQMTRRIIRSDRTFDGVIVVSLDPTYLSRFYDSVDLGRRGIVLLAGTDGVVRAGTVATHARHDGAGGQDDESLVGRDIAGGVLIGKVKSSSQGTLDDLTDPDGVRRIVAYRLVRDFPLIVAVGTATDEVLEGYESNHKSYTVLAFTLTVLLLGVVTAVIVRQTRLNRARRELAASEARSAQESALLQTTLEHMSQGIMMVDGERRVQVCNQEAIDKLGLPEELIARRPLFDEVLKWQWQSQEFGLGGQNVDEEIRKFILAGGMTDKPHIYERVRPDGRVLEIRSTPLRGGGVVRTYTDITLHKRSEAVLRNARDEADQAARAKAEFLATMSHEIRSPMSGLLGVLELLRNSDLDAEQSRMASMIHGSAAGLLAVLNDILDFSKIEANALAIMAEPTDLRTVVSDLVQPHNLAASRKGVLLTLEVADDVPAWVTVDPLRLSQILQNLLSNAVKFTASGTIVLTVGVSRETDTPWLWFTVRDSGIGIDESVMSHLFEPFSQADGSTTRIFGGTGLGLSISRRLATMMQGSLSVSSALGLGSEFRLMLPLLVCNEGKGERASPSEPSLRRGLCGTGSVLVVDDDNTNRWLSQRQLEWLGLSVEVAENGEAALRVLASRSFDLLVTDCHMPRMDGIALTKAVRASTEPALRDVPVIGLTADVTTQQRDRCMAAGMNEVLIKPINIERMARVAAAYIPVARMAAMPEAPQLERAATVQPGVFDDRAFRDLFDGDDPDGPAWLQDYLAIAQTAGARLRALLSLSNTSELDRTEVADIAHRLAGSSLSVGAVRLGSAARTLEHAALDTDMSDGAIRARFEAMQRELDDARQTILAVLSSEPAAS